MSKYLVVYENAGRNWSAYVPDLEGCVTSGESQKECKESIKEAIELFIEATRRSGGVIPEPSSLAEYIKVA